ncbi:MAG: twin-arginine translocation signal domain-containing protein [Allosphingosinicella sp.]
MSEKRKLSRRSFMGRVVGGAVAGGGALVLLSGRAEALQVSDSDSGGNSDPAGRGYTGYSDSDSGGNADRANHGRSRQGARTSARGCTDNDSGPNSDRAGAGRGNGVTDNDSGSNADRAGCGRGH